MVRNIKVMGKVCTFDDKIGKSHSLKIDSEGCIKFKGKLIEVVKDKSVKCPELINKGLVYKFKLRCSK